MGKFSEQDAAAAGEVEPIFLEFGGGKLRGFPPCNDGPVPTWGEIELMFADDFAQAASDSIAFNSAADFFACDETKAEMGEIFDRSGREHKGPTGLSPAFFTQLGEVTGLLQPQV